MHGTGSKVSAEAIDVAVTPRFARRGGRRRPPLHNHSWILRVRGIYQPASDLCTARL